MVLNFLLAALAAQVPDSIAMDPLLPVVSVPTPSPLPSPVSDSAPILPTALLDSIGQPPPARPDTSARIPPVILPTPVAAPPAAPPTDSVVPKVSAPEPLAKASAPITFNDSVSPARSVQKPSPQVRRYGAWQVGAALAGSPGSGISVRRWLGDADALQFNIAPYVSRRNYPGTDDPNQRGAHIDSGFVLDASLIAGVSWLHQLAFLPLWDDRGEVKILSYCAGATWLSVEQQQMDRWATKSDGTTQVRFYDDYYREKREFRVGGGGGFELSRWRLSTDLMLGMSAWIEAISGDMGVAPDAQWGVHFRF